MSRTRAYFFCLLLSIVFPVLVASVGYAQQSVNSAILSGQVTEAGGAAVAGATLTAVNLEKNQKWVAMTDPQGRFKLVYLPIGSYEVRAEATGFALVERKLTLTIGQSLDLLIRLSVGNISEHIEIVSDSTGIELARSEVAETILSREVDSLPLNGRNFLDLAALTPGVSRGNPVANQRFAETTAVPGTQISASGQRNINNGFVMDGLSANDDAADLPATFFSQEVIHEFQVITSGGIAEFGRASSGIVNVATNSGTNIWHGRFYGFLRNQRLDARNPLSATKDPLTQTQYGITGGGPIVRNRTFIFGNFEQTRLNNAVVVTITPFNVTAVNAALKQAGYPGAPISTGLAPAGYDSTNVLARFDHRLNDSNSLTARYSVYDISGFNSRGVGGLNAESRGTALINQDHTIAVGEVAALSSRTTNELRTQFTRSRLGAPPNDLKGPAVNIAGVANLGTFTSSPTERDIDLFEVLDNVTTVRGAHSIKFGVDFLYNRVDIEFPGALQGVYTFPNTGALITKTYTQFQQAFGEPSQLQSNPNIGIFVQDQWRATRSLTINAGLRYDAQWLPEPIRMDGNNVAPRLGIAWSPDGGAFVARASYGIYYERIPLRATSNALQRDGSKYRVALFSFGQVGAPTFPAVAQSYPEFFLPSITTIDPEISNAYTQQASLQLERALWTSTTLSAGYVYTRGLHLILSRNVNVPRFPASAGVPNLGRPNPNYGNISRYESSGDSYYHALTLSLNRRFSRWFGARVSYTLSKAIDNAGNAFFFTPQDNFNLRDDRGLGDNDQRHLLAVSGTLEAVPGSTSEWWRKVINGFQLSYIFRYGSALPFNILTGTDRNFDTSVNDRPEGVARNAGVGFDFASFDFRLSRRFRITERWNFDILAEAFNLFNRANYQLPNNTFGPGSVPRPGFGNPTAAADPRQFQFGLRLNF